MNPMINTRTKPDKASAKHSIATAAPQPSARSTDSTDDWAAALLDKTHPFRVAVQLRIERELRLKHPMKPAWQAKCGTMAAQLETVLFKVAKSLEEYRNEATISQRLAAIALSKQQHQHQPHQPAQLPVANFQRATPLFSSMSAPILACITLLHKARSCWLESAEVEFLFTQFTTVPVSDGIILSDRTISSAGKLFQFSLGVAYDDYAWQANSDSKASSQLGGPNTEVAWERNGQILLLVSQTVTRDRTLWKRVYYACAFPDRMMVHYLDCDPSVRDQKNVSARSVANMPSVVHGSDCACLECRAMNLYYASQAAMARFTSAAAVLPHMMSPLVGLPNINLFPQLPLMNQHPHPTSATTMMTAPYLQQQPSSSLKRVSTGNKSPGVDEDDKKQRLD